MTRWPSDEGGSGGGGDSLDTRGENRLQVDMLWWWKERTKVSGVYFSTALGLRVIRVHSVIHWPCHHFDIQLGLLDGAHSHCLHLQSSAQAVVSGRKSGRYTSPHHTSARLFSQAEFPSRLRLPVLQDRMHSRITKFLEFSGTKV